LGAERKTQNVERRNKTQNAEGETVNEPFPVLRFAFFVLLAFTAACGRGTPPASNAASPAADWFTDKARETGLDFVHFNGMSGEFYYPEIMPPGVALFDFDNDGDLDVFVVQGRMLGSTPIDRAWAAPRGGSPLGGRLFRNDLTVGADGRRTLRFTDVTDGSGISARGYGMGVATGDYNNDGCVDLYVTSFGTNQVLRFDGTTGAFVDAFVSAGDGGLSLPRDLVFGPDSNLYVGSFGTGDIFRYNGTTGTFMDDFVAAGSGALGGPTFLLFGEGGSAATPEPSTLGLLACGLAGLAAWKRKTIHASGQLL